MSCATDTVVGQVPRGFYVDIIQQHSQGFPGLTEEIFNLLSSIFN